jgi:hypothetical protein
MKKQLPTDAIASELSQSVFFQKPVDQPVDQRVDPVQKQAVKPHSPPESRHSPTPSIPEVSKQDSITDVMPDVVTDVMTSLPQEVNLRKWQEIIENTETQNSALRLTSEERYAVEDVVNELRRKYGVKTSMNEVIRLGLLLLVHDFKKHKKESVIYKVKKA